MLPLRKRLRSFVDVFQAILTPLELLFCCISSALISFVRPGIWRSNCFGAVTGVAKRGDFARSMNSDGPLSASRRPQGPNLPTTNMSFVRTAPAGCSNMQIRGNGGRWQRSNFCRKLVSRPPVHRQGFHSMPHPLRKSLMNEMMNINS